MTNLSHLLFYFYFYYYYFIFLYFFYFFSHLFNLIIWCFYRKIYQRRKEKFEIGKTLKRNKKNLSLIFSSPQLVKRSGTISLPIHIHYRRYCSLSSMKMPGLDKYKRWRNRIFMKYWMLETLLLVLIWIIEEGMQVDHGNWDCYMGNEEVFWFKKRIQETIDRAAVWRIFEASTCTMRDEWILSDLVGITACIRWEN